MSACRRWMRLFYEKGKYMQNTELLLKELTLEEKCALLSGAETFKTRVCPNTASRRSGCRTVPTACASRRGERPLGAESQRSRHLLPHGVGCCKQLGCRAGRGNRRSLGREAAAQEVSVVLGPGLNMKRNPLCGRSFEYFSEDPYLAGKLAAGYIRGIQSRA